jgi:pimeloyl-ACP methyl ester carboxylesterase
VGATKTPTLLIWGKEDQTVPIALADSVRAAIPQAQFHAIDKAGHLPHMERTDVVNPLLLNFLRSTMPAPADTAGSQAGVHRE